MKVNVHVVGGIGLITTLGLVIGGMMYSDKKYEEAYQKEEWVQAPKVYVCTAEETARVQTDTKFCNDNTSYFSTYCYGTSIMRNCTKKKE